MNHPKYNTLIDTLNALKNKNFTSSFQLKEDKMTCLESGKRYLPNNISIIESFRFEGNSNPSDMSILFAIECEDGNRGTIISPYGVYADAKLVEFMGNVKIRNEKKTSSPNS